MRRNFRFAFTNLSLWCSGTSQVVRGWDDALSWLVGGSLRITLYNISQPQGMYVFDKTLVGVLSFCHGSFMTMWYLDPSSVP